MLSEILNDKQDCIYLVYYIYIWVVFIEKGFDIWDLMVSEISDPIEAISSVLPV